MFKSKSLFVGGLALLLGAAIVPSWLRTAQGNVPQDRVITSQDVTTAYWIGVQVVPVPKLFLPHFGEADESGSRIAVEYVVPDSPADKAGLKRGDILLKFGESEIHSLPNLIEQVSRVGETETKFDVVRNGTRTTLTIVPAQRPEVSRIQPEVLGMRETPQTPLMQMPMPQIPQFGRRLPTDAFSGRDPLMMMRQMEDFFRQMQGGNDADDVLLIPNSQQRIANTGTQLSVVMQTDQSGKSWSR